LGVNPVRSACSAHHSPPDNTLLEYLLRGAGLKVHFYEIVFYNQHFLLVSKDMPSHYSISIKKLGCFAYAKDTDEV
jgi:hypothetical protein